MKLNILNPIFSKRIYFPGFIFFLTVIPLIIISAALIRFDQTKYVATTSLSTLLNVSVSFQQEQERHEKKTTAFPEQSNEATSTTKLQADLTTFILWGIIGTFIYLICNSFFAIFLSPIVEDLKELHYVNINTKKLRENRLLWMASILFTIISLIAVIVVFKYVVLPYYSVTLYETTFVNFYLLAAGIVLNSLLLAFFIVGTHTTSKLR